MGLEIGRIDHDGLRLGPLGGQTFHHPATRAERQATWPLLQALVSMLQPKRIVAIGRDAHLALDGLGIPTTAIRHPSYGGQREFIDGMFDLYGIADTPRAPELPLEPRYAATSTCALA